jgi:hypothetical protein
LFHQAALMTLESRLTLALALPAHVSRSACCWSRSGRPSVEGRTVSIPDSLRGQFYFRSLVRPAALLLTATLAIEPAHPLVAPLFHTVVSRGRELNSWWWNTQDYAAAVRAVDAWLRRFPPAGAPEVRVRAGDRTRGTRQQCGADRLAQPAQRQRHPPGHPQNASRRVPTTRSRS